MQRVAALFGHDADVDSIEQGADSLALPGTRLEDLPIRPLSQGPARLLARPIWLHVVACIRAICAVGKDRVPPFPVDEKVPHLVEYLAIWFERVRLEQENLGCSGGLRVLFKVAGPLPEKVHRLPIDCPLAEEGEVADLHKELVPPLLLHVLHALFRIEAVLVVDRWDQRDACLLALLHVPGLVHDPIVVVPTRIKTAVGVLMHLHHLCDMFLISAHDGNSNVVPEVQVDVVFLEPPLGDFPAGDDVDLQNVGVQRLHLERGGDVDLILSPVPVPQDQVLRIVRVVGALFHGVEVLANEDADPDLLKGSVLLKQRFPSTLYTNSFRLHRGGLGHHLARTVQRSQPVELAKADTGC
mmetsp:Transcript_41916/g.115577  ORF Transcript_41916/g.115577 Transcript_41916/m.115577 type:complete len:355 (-) Transcript_41916:55-1119(-)